MVLLYLLDGPPDNNRQADGVEIGTALHLYISDSMLYLHTTTTSIPLEI